MRIAHIIMTHKNPKQLLRLIKSLQHPQSDFYIHVDKKVNIEEFLHVSKISQVYFIKNRVKCNWGGNSFLHCIISTLKEVLATGVKYDFLNLLSGQDYPIKSPDKIHDFFLNNIGKNFISYEGIQDSQWWKGAINRYEKYHLTDSNFKLKYLVQLFVNVIFPKRKFPLQIELFGGSKSSWWTIGSDCAQYLVDSITKNVQLVNFLKYSWGTDEFVITTLIMNSSYRETTINNNLRYIDWSEAKANPKILSSKDFPILSDSSMLFARKFDINVDSNILDYIDRNLL